MSVMKVEVEGVSQGSYGVTPAGIPFEIGFEDAVVAKNPRYSSHDYAHNLEFISQLELKAKEQGLEQTYMSKVLLKNNGIKNAQIMTNFLYFDNAISYIIKNTPTLEVRTVMSGGRSASVVGFRYQPGADSSVFQVIGVVDSSVMDQLLGK